MKKLMFLMIVSVMALCGCSGRVDENGELSDFSYRGRFRGINFYAVTVSSGYSVLVGIKEDGIVSINQSSGKTSIDTIIINGKPVTIEKAKKMLANQ